MRASRQISKMYEISTQTHTNMGCTGTQVTQKTDSKIDYATDDENQEFSLYASVYVTWVAIWDVRDALDARR